MKLRKQRTSPEQERELAERKLRFAVISALTNGSGIGTVEDIVGVAHYQWEQVTTNSEQISSSLVVSEEVNNG